jgi:DNA-directed RNA polymerase subunit M/transcription elongation factor TFIIS
MDIESQRIRGKDALRTVIKKEQNIETLERNIYEKSSNYLLSIFEIINDIKSGLKLNEILSNIKKTNIGWNHDSLKDAIFEEEEQNNFIIQPFEVYEGVLTCKCGSKRVYSYQKQSRSADEPMSTYATCMSCKSKWVYSG